MFTQALGKIILYIAGSLILSLLLGLIMVLLIGGSAIDILMSWLT
ncbi:hypothetical protein [Jeotgalibacillus proteolyticus]|nr:hypothetical protein [Jeotgalibacillus proteolyticus]